MADITHGTWIKDGGAVDTVYQNGVKVYGRNLLTNTGDLSANWDLTQRDTVDTSQNPAVLHYTKATVIASSYTIAQQQLNDGLLQPSTTYTASFYAKGTGTFLFFCFPSVSTGVSDTRTRIVLTSDYKLYTITFTTVPNLSGNKNLLLTQVYSPSATEQNTIEAYIYGLKLEKGTTATPYSPALEDVSDYGRNLLTGTGNHTVTGTEVNNGYLSNETNDDFLTLFKGLEGQAVTVSVDYKYSGFVAGSGSNHLGWETAITSDSTLFLGAWYSPNNDSGSGRISSTFVVPENITGVGENMGYIQFSGSGTGTLSHLKLEKGSVATPWTPAPEDTPN